jgi:hypothetical protein
LYAFFMCCEMSVGTLRIYLVYGVRNPRDRGSGNHTSLLKFHLEIERILKKKGHRYNIGNGTRRWLEG